MRVYRGSADTPECDRRVTARVSRTAADTTRTALRVWYPRPHVAFGRRDARADGYERAREIAADRGYPPMERDTGGRAVAFTGNILAIALAEPADATNAAIDERYERAVATLETALRDLGVDARRGEPPNSFCPGTHSLQTEAGKVAGLAQRVRRDVAIVAGAVVVEDAPAVASGLEPVYEALGVPFDPESVGSLAASADGPLDSATVREEIEAAFVGDRPTTVVNVRDT
jgi:lipoate-protein ligase A